MKILFTGCCRFIGYHLTQKLITHPKIVGIDHLNSYCDINYKKNLLKKLKMKKVSKTNNNEPLIIYSNNNKLYKFIKYKPNVNIKKGISEFIKWYKNN